MNYHKGPERAQTQLLPPCLEDYVGVNASVRFIDAFVEGLDLKALGFERAELSATGRPPYDPADLLKLYVYGYLNRIRSSRRLEAESKRNLELMWLLRAVSPDFKTIADFRKDNRACFKGVLKQFNLLCRKLDLFGAELVVIDGSKFKASNNPKRYCRPEDLAALVKQVEARIENYLAQLDQADEESQGAGAASASAGLKEKLAALRERKGQYEQWIEELNEPDPRAMGATDLESRGQPHVGIGYNAQIAVDAKHHLIVTSEVVQDANDLEQLNPMAQAARQELAVGQLKVVADAGYHSAAQLAACEAGHIEAYLPLNRHASGQSTKGKAVYPKESFIYDPVRDVYQCPGAKELTRSQERPNPKRPRVCYDNFSACQHCSLKTQCTQGRYRRIYRVPDEPAVERLRERNRAHPELLARRKSIVEHVFGTICNWGQHEFITRGLVAVRAEFTLSALAYNLRRVLQTVSLAKLLKITSRLA